MWDGQVVGPEALKPYSVKYGTVYLDGDPVVPEDPTPKSYVDASLSTLDDDMKDYVDGKFPLVGYWMKQPPVKIPDPYYVTLPASDAMTEILSTTITLTEVSDIKAQVSGLFYCNPNAAGKIIWSFSFKMDGSAPVDQDPITSDQYASAAGDYRLSFSLCYHWESLAVGAHILKFDVNESAYTARARRVYRACLIPEVCII